MDKILKCENTAMERLLSFRLPTNYKMIGLISFLALLILLFVLPDEGNTADILKAFTKKLMLLSLLAISLAKEKVEDERITSLRAKDFQVSFIWAIVYAALQPLATLLVSQFVEVEGLSEMIKMNSFQILFFMLLIQIGIFQLMKKVVA